MLMSSDTDSAPTAPASPAGGIWAPAQRSLTVGLVLAVTFVAFEALAVATILPVVGRQLGDLRLYGWVFSAFLLASLIGIVLAGTLADRVPLGRPMLVGLVLFALGLIIGGTAPDMLVLVAGRAVQGLGAGVVPSVAYVAISRCYAEEARPRMFAVLSTAWVVPGLIGPAIAALVAAAVGWRWVFLGLLPLVIAAGVLVVLALRHVPPPASPGTAAVPYLAVLGVVAGAGTALASISSGVAPVVAAGGVAGGALLALSMRQLTPPRYLTARPGLTVTILSRSLLTCCFFAGDAYVPFAIVTVRHAPTALAALALTASTLTWTAGSWVQARCIARWGPRRLVRPGLCLVAIGLGANVRGAPAGGASRAGDRGLGVGRRGDRHCLRSAVGDHARSRGTGRGGPGDLGSSALRCTRSGHRHRGGGGHRGRRLPDRAPPWSRAGVRVRYRGRADRGHLRSAASRQHPSGRCG